MKLNRRSLSMLIVLMSIGLLLGGAIHSSLHADEHGDCHVCHLAIADLLEDGPLVGNPTELISARDEGVRVWADQYPYATSGSDGNTVLIPSWATGSGRGNGPSPAESVGAVLADPAAAADLRTDIAHEIRRRGGADRVVVFEYPREEWVGKNLLEIADERGVDPVQMAIDLQLEGDPERRGGGRLRDSRCRRSTSRRTPLSRGSRRPRTGGSRCPETAPCIRASTARSRARSDTTR